MNFETWLEMFYTTLAKHFVVNEDGTPCTAADIRKWNMDEIELRQQFDSGEGPKEAALNEFDAMCALG